MDDDAKSRNLSLAKLIMNDLMALLNRHRIAVDECGISEADMGLLNLFRCSGYLTHKEVKTIMGKVVEIEMAKRPPKQDKTEAHDGSDLAL